MHSLLVGLGNPGNKYSGTRHNAGITVLRHWVEAMDKQGHPVTPWEKDQRASAEIATVKCPSAAITCVFPLTSMNNSGLALIPLVKGKWWQFKKNFPAGRILIIHDEIDLPLGAFKLKTGGSARGHNGVRSIHDALGTDQIPRLLIGISRPQGLPVKDYVLQNFSPAEREKLNQSLPQIFEKINEFIM